MYQRDYYENGIEMGLSCYQNYRWIPELTVPMAMTMIDYLGIKRHDSILEIGCAKGYLVKAFRVLYRKAYGIDISHYAIHNADSEIKNFCYWGTLNKESSKYLPMIKFSVCIAKDVFEHITKPDLIDILKYIPSTRLFVIVPLGNGNGQYIALNNNMDKTHVICESADWWLKFFGMQKWTVEKFTYQIPGIKENYYEHYPKAHGFFTLQKI